MDNRSQDHTDYFNTFIRTAQYITHLTPQQDILTETGNALVRFYGANTVGFFEQPNGRKLTGHHWILPDGIVPARFMTHEIQGVVAEVMETGFLATHRIEPEGLSAVFLPIMWESKIMAVMTVAHKTPGPLQDELLNSYLAISGLVSTAVSSAVVSFNTIAEKKRAEESLKVARENLAFLVKNTPAMLYRFHASGDRAVTFISENVRDQLGCEPEAFMDNPAFFESRIHPDDRVQIQQCVENALSAGAATVEYRFLRNDGTWRWMHDEMRPIRSKTGEPAELIGYWIDITQKKKVEETLVRNNEELSALNEELNAINEELTATQEELRQANDELAKNEQDLLRKNDDLRMINEEQIAMQEELQQNNEELLKAERALSETGQYLDNLINYANAPIIVWNPQFRITRFNHAFERLTGRAAETVIGRSLDILFPEDRKIEMMTKIRSTILGEQWESVEIPIRHFDESVRIVLWNSATLFRPDGKSVLSVIAQGQDITLRKRIEADLVLKNKELTDVEQELRQNVDKLAASERMLIENEAKLREALAEKDVLLAEIHHRVKNNLTAFISLLSLEGSTEDTPTGRLLRQDLQNRARSMALIHETLYRTNKFDEVDVGVYLTTLVGQIANSFRTTPSVKTLIDAHGVMLDLPRATPLGLIVNELVTNSFKYAFPDSFDVEAIRNAPPTIAIALAKEDGTYILSFGDNGVGLPTGIDLTKTQTLGLKLVNFLARHQLRAKIEVNSENGVEFVFRFRENGE